jgi:hypothetical protein
VIVPRGNGAEAALVAGADVRVADSLLEVCAHLAGRAELAAAQRSPRPTRRRTLRTWPKCVVSLKRAERWRLPRPAATACC